MEVKALTKHPADEGTMEHLVSNVNIEDIAKTSFEEVIGEGVEESLVVQVVNVCSHASSPPSVPTSTLPSTLVGLMCAPKGGGQGGEGPSRASSSGDVARSESIQDMVD